MNNYFTVGRINFLGQVSNFQIDLLTEITPQLTNNPCESLNLVLQNKYNLGHVYFATMVSGIPDFLVKDGINIEFLRPG